MNWRDEVSKNMIDLSKNPRIFKKSNYFDFIELVPLYLQKEVIHV
jgi:hypothetical protein